jgi:hypothetical protein
VNSVLVLLAGFFAGAACASAGASFAHSRTSRLQHGYIPLSARMEPYLRPARESIEGQGLGAEAERWLQGGAGH